MVLALSGKPATAWDPFYNISSNDKTGNPNPQFPWHKPFGTDDTDSGVFRFVHLPGPITYGDKTLSRFLFPREQTFKVWEYPDGTVFGEVMTVKSGKKEFVFDVRVREKVKGKWLANAYRPVLTRGELEAWLRKNHPNVKLGEPKVLIRRMKDGNQNAVIDAEAALDELPEMPSGVVREVLGLPFRSALGQEWIVHNKVEGYAPTTRAEFGIVPKGYLGGMVRVDSKSCMRCHESVLKDADDFDKRRDWYGRVSGSDGIFSFHIFEPSCISPGPYRRELVIRRSLLDAWLLKEK
jgi:hypothetical protein